MRSISLLLLLSFLLTSCYEDFDNSVTIVEVEQPKTEMGTKLTGELIKSNGLLEDDYTITINGELHYVENNTFYVDLDKVYKYGQLIEAFKDDELVGVAYPYLLENDINKIEIDEIELTRSSFNSEREIQFGDKVKANLSPEQFANTSAGLMLETATLETDAIFSAFGNSGFTAAGQLLHLEASSAFILNVYSQGVKTKLLDEETLRLEVNADENESLFVYSHDLEYWVEISQLELSNVLTDQTGYFMIAQSSDAIEVETTIEEAGQPVSYLRTNISINSNAKVFTTQAGKLSLVMPILSQAELTFETQCGDLISEYTISSEDTRTKEEVTISDDNNLIIPVTTTVVDCDGKTSELQALEVTGDGTSDRYFFDTQAIDNRMALCNDDYSISGFDTESNSSGTQVTWDNSSQDALDILTNCNDLKDGFSYIMIRDDIKVYESFEVSFENGETTVQSMDGKVRFKFRGSSVGAYQDEQINIFMEDDAFGEFGYSIPCETSTLGCGISEFNVTQLESSSGQVRISFSGEVHASTIENFQYGGFEVSGVIVISE